MLTARRGAAASATEGVVDEGAVEVIVVKTETVLVVNSVSPLVEAVTEPLPLWVPDEEPAAAASEPAEEGSDVAEGEPPAPAAPEAAVNVASMDVVAVASASSDDASSTLDSLSTLVA